MKTESIRIRVSEKDKELFERNAEIMNMTLTDYIKYCCISNLPDEVLREKLKSKR